MNKNDIAFTPAIQQAELIRTREISPLELTQIYLERIDRLNPKLGSFFTVAAELALADATAKTEQLTATNTDNLPPFFGVPTAVKDLNAVAGVPRCCGVAALRQKVEQYDEGVVVRMKQAGFTILGKTATSQLGSLPYTEPPGLPPARNPWNLDYTAGGSSGGAAAAVAAGLCAVAQGSDGGGSIRIPAACCGIVGIKPSRGRVSYAPLGDCLSGIATNGPLGRTVADTAAFLDVISGYITGDPYWLPAPKPSFLEVATAAKPGKLRIAFATNIPPFGEAALPCKQAVEKTAALLESLGHSLEVGCPTVGDLIEPFITVWQTSIPFSGVPPQLLEPMNQWLLEKANRVSSGKYLEAVAAMQIISRRIVAFFDNFDALLLPVTMQPPIRVGEWSQLSPEDAFPKIVNWVAPCAPFNASGQPSIAMAAGFHAGVPVGVQIVGRPGDESTIIALAAQIEAASPRMDNRSELMV